MLPTFTARRQPRPGRTLPDARARDPRGSMRPGARPIAGAALAAVTGFQAGPQAEIKVGLLKRLFVVSQRRFIRGQRHGKS
jgi:hypothetical protein